MVKEFTDLQGIVGGLYARHQGEPEAIAKAIYDHYKPLSMEDTIPSTRDGQIVALADKLDTLRGCFVASAWCRLDRKTRLLFAARHKVSSRFWSRASSTIKLDDLASGELREFLLDRIKYYFREVRGFAYDEVNAVLAAGVTTIENVEARLEWLAKVRPTQDFEPLAVSFKRINNILKQANFASDGEINIALLEEGPEKRSL